MFDNNDATLQITLVKNVYSPKYRSKLKTGSAISTKIVLHGIEMPEEYHACNTGKKQGQCGGNTGVEALIQIQEVLHPELPHSE